MTNPHSTMYKNPMITINFRAIPKAWRALSRSVDSEGLEEARQLPAACQRKPLKEASMLRLLWDEIWRRRRFESLEVDRLYQRYVMQSNFTHLVHLIMLLIATCFVMEPGLIFINLVVTDDLEDSGNTDLTVFSLAVILFSVGDYFCSLVILFRCDIAGISMTVVSYMLILTFILQEMVLSFSTAHLWSTVAYVYMVHALLPIRLQEAIVCSLVLSLTNYPVRHMRNKNPSESVFHYDQEVSNLLIIACINMIGVLTHFTSDMAKRKAFNETRHFVAARIAIQHETRRQKKLVMSVLPEHLAEEMTADIAAVSGTVNEMHSLIYIKSYDPVSIIFADIRGFTAMADASPAQRVVELLNELYCRFDKLAAKNRCLRIKLLGDCYHAVSGLPLPTPYHADYCVILGLEIVDSMHMVREKFDVDVGIRVGIHSGQVNCGVLGLKKWQFDVWSKDVTLANQMESGGVPGLVHISEATKNYLSNPSCYVCEPANGGEREPALKNINTFFITAKTPEEGFETKKSIGLLTRNENEELFNLYHALGTETVLFSPMTAKERTIEKEVMSTMNSSINSRSLRRLKKINCKPCVLKFRNKELEREYNHEPDQMLQTYFVTSALVFVIMSIVQLMLIPIDLMLSGCSMVGFVWTTFATSLVLARSCPKSFPSRMVELSAKMSSHRCLAQFLAILTIMLIFIAITLPVVTLDCRHHNYPRGREKSVLPGTNYQNTIRERCPSWYMSYLEYTLLYIMMITALAGAFQIITFTWKAFVMVCNFLIYNSLFFTAPNFMNMWTAKSSAYYKYYVMLIMLASHMLLILIHSQQSEIIQRLDFIWKRQANDEKDEVQKMQKINQKLIDNILPAHVAKIYLEKDHQHDELYHETCDSACILFASITNFFFTSDASENLTVLNKIITDFDSILNEEQFQCIEKIKSSGAVYMAASGISKSTSDVSQTDHVVQMAAYALRLKLHVRDVLNKKLGTKFIIQIGMHVGPVIAGVIGASMPQYDIWGNTVNVASRMYSTGLPNEIQVTEEVASILRSNGFSITRRGKVFVKGKGEMNTSFLREENTSSNTSWSPVNLFRGSTDVRM